MRVTNHETDAQRRVFIGYVAFVIAVCVAVIEVLSVFTTSTTTGASEHDLYPWWDQAAFLAERGYQFGLFFVAAAFLLMMDSEDESKAMTVVICMCGIIGVLMILFGVSGITDVSLSTQFGSSVSDKIEGLLYCASTTCWVSPLLALPGRY